MMKSKHSKNQKHDKHDGTDTYQKRDTSKPSVSTACTDDAIVQKEKVIADYIAKVALL